MPDLAALRNGGMRGRKVGLPVHIPLNMSGTNPPPARSGSRETHESPASDVTREPPEVLEPG